MIRARHKLLFPGLLGSARGYLLDPAVADFAATSGATDLTGLDALMSYVRLQGLLSNFRIYPMKSAQNAGSGSTVYGLGGLTSNDTTLVSGPTWGADGIDFNGSTQYGTIPDFLAAETLTVFSRGVVSSTSPGAGTRALVAQFEGGLNRSFLLGYNYGAGLGTRVFRSSDGSGTNQEAYENESNSLPGSDTTVVAQWTDGGGRAVWHDKTLQALVLFGGAAQTSRFDESTDITVAASDATTPTAHIPVEMKAVAFVSGTLTTAQREAITDLVNAL